MGDYTIQEGLCPAAQNLAGVVPAELQWRKRIGERVDGSAQGTQPDSS